MVTQGGERVVSVIPNATLKAGFMGVKTRVHTVVLTDRRVLFVRFTMADGKQLAQEARAAGKSQRQGWDLLMTHFLATDPEVLLAQNEDNFAVALSEVKQAKVKTASTGAGDSGDALLLKTTQKKYQFLLGGSRDQAREALVAAGLPQ